jgi:CRISPR-associated endonuclease Csn1
MIEIRKFGGAMGYRIGVDVGDMSVGLAAVEYDSKGTPIRILAAVSHIHDGGLDPDTAKSPLSRTNTSGVARRTRRLLRNRRKRLARLDQVLLDLGIPVSEVELPQTHDAWHYRDVLSRVYESDDAERLRGVSMAVRHIARHRGWRNPWWKWSALSAAPAPSENFVETRSAGVERFGNDLASCQTMGQMVMKIASSGAPIRSTDKARKQESVPLMSRRIDQVDSLHELRLILATQRFSDEQIEMICAATFWQEKPYVPKDRIGECDLIDGEVRASRSALEYQEFRVLSAVANLRIGRARTSLTAEQHDKVVDFLLSWREDDRPRWADVAEVLGVTPRELIAPTIDDLGGTGAVCDRTSQSIEKHFKKKSGVRKWWDAADLSARSEFVELVTDVTGNDEEPSAEGLADLLSDEDQLESIEKLKIQESGRAAYSRKALALLNKEMREHRCDLHEARKRAFGFTDDWQPKKDSFDIPVGHPAVDRVNVIVRRFMKTAIAKWGEPEAVMVEHVRTAFMGPTGRADFLREIKKNTDLRDKKKKELSAQGVERPSNTDVRRLDSLSLQQGMCLYCGATLTLTTCELDHIVPRASGGGNTRDNLVAVCRPCNQDKGRQPFAVWAQSSPRPEVSLKLAQERVKAFKSDDLRGRNLYRLQRDIARRLAMETDDSEGMDRSIESTAYAARAMRERIESELGLERSSIIDPDQARVFVFQGVVTSEARKAGEIDGLLKLRNMSHSKRFDRRHHAVDALVLTTLKPGVARTLKDRAELKSDNRFTGEESDWRNYSGKTTTEITRFKEWQKQAQALASLITVAVRDDKIAVARPLRLSPRIGSVHKDTVEKLVSKQLNEAFSSEDLERIVDAHLYERLLELTDGESTLSPDPQRHERLELPVDYTVKLFPSNAAYIALRGGAAKIGDSIKHARIYAWKTKTGFGFGQIRVYTAEFPKIGFLKTGVDIFTEPLPLNSQSFRHANDALKKRILSGEAKQIGWIATDDEIELDVSKFIAGEEKLPRFLQETPEPRWTITGFFAPVQISIAPSYLAFEGVDETTPQIVSETLRDNRIAMGLNVLLQDPNLLIIRRTSLGTIRWIPNGLPATWSPHQAATEAFGK